MADFPRWPFDPDGVLQDWSEGRMSIERAAKYLHLQYHELLSLAVRKGFSVPTAETVSPHRDAFSGERYATELPLNDEKRNFRMDDIEPEIVEQTPEEAADKVKWDAIYLKKVQNTDHTREDLANLVEAVGNAGVSISDYTFKAEKIELTAAQAAFQKVEDATHLAGLALSEAIYWLDRARELVGDPAGSMTALYTPVIHTMDVRPTYDRSGTPIWEVRAAPIEGVTTLASYRGDWYFTIDEAKKRTGILDVTAYADWKGMSDRLPIAIYENVAVPADAPELSWTPHQWAEAIREKAAPIVAKLIADHDEYYRKMREDIERGEFDDGDQDQALPET
ncbi:hypothetical protein HFO61_30445 [Rhizobium leguminosarum]|uniref:hypothetical protein n=1 Tax=Rhizobium leguminosarum TaxID=384 RepID=UPI001C947981|nr:hypothetical protein [Rhizobium leguminosarum]MBY5551066.1 hypothetical protein [Rhizobium leguminosarum]